MPNATDVTPEKEMPPPPDPAWYAKFLVALARSPNVAGACRKVGITRPTAYRHRHDDPAFAEAWQTALDDAVDTLEANVWTRAKKSDTLAIFMLKAHRPGVYRETIHQIQTGKGGGPIQHAHSVDLTGLTSDDLDTLELLLRKAGAAP